MSLSFQSRNGNHIVPGNTEYQQYGIGTRYCTYGKHCSNSVARWKLVCFDKEALAYTIYAYTNEMSELDTISVRRRAMTITLSGYYHRCTNTVEESDLTDYTNPDQYLPWRSHNQPHG